MAVRAKAQLICRKKNCLLFINILTSICKINADVLILTWNHLQRRK